jgi:hypothetical protein
MASSCKLNPYPLEPLRRGQLYVALFRNEAGHGQSVRSNLWSLKRPEPGPNGNESRGVRNFPYLGVSISEPIRT